MGQWLSCRVLGLEALLLLLPVKAWADFIIEFINGRQVTVGRYVDEGQTIKIYTARGTIGFRKDDVKRITKVGANQNANLLMEALQVYPSLTNRGKAAEASNTSEANRKEAAEAGKATEVELERLDKQYQEVAQQLDEAWKKHMQDVNSGASAEALAENRRRLNELNQERYKLIKASRQADPNDLPAWAH